MARLTAFFESFYFSIATMLNVVEGTIKHIFDVIDTAVGWVGELFSWLTAYTKGSIDGGQSIRELQRIGEYIMTKMRSWATKIDDAIGNHRSIGGPAAASIAVPATGS